MKTHGRLLFDDPIESIRSIKVRHQAGTARHDAMVCVYYCLYVWEEASHLIMDDHHNAPTGWYKKSIWKMGEIAVSKQYYGQILFEVILMASNDDDRLANGVESLIFPSFVGTFFVLLSELLVNEINVTCLTVFFLTNIIVFLFCYC